MPSQDLAQTGSFEDWLELAFHCLDSSGFIFFSAFKAVTLGMFFKKEDLMQVSMTYIFRIIKS